MSVKQVCIQLNIFFRIQNTSADDEEMKAQRTGPLRADEKRKKNTLTDTKCPHNCILASFSCRVASVACDAYAFLSRRCLSASSLPFLWATPHFEPVLVHLQRPPDPSALVDCVHDLTNQFSAPVSSFKYFNYSFQIMHAFFKCSPQSVSSCQV
jgi:hypothetical protein